MAAAEDNPRSSVVVLLALQRMKLEFRDEFFLVFNTFMQERIVHEGGSRELDALGVFRMRRELSIILDEYVIRIQGFGVGYNLTDALRNEIHQRITGVYDAWCAADVRAQADIRLIQNLVEAITTEFMITTYNVVVVDTGDQKGHCIICLDHWAEIIFLPCGHACICAACYPAYVAANVVLKCSSCREIVRGTEPLSQRQILSLLAGGQARHSRHGPIFIQADAKRSFCVMGNVHIPGLS